MSYRCVFQTGWFSYKAFIKFLDINNEYLKKVRRINNFKIKYQARE